MYERMIRAFQLKIANQVRTEIFNPILESNGFEPNIVKMKFNSVTDADEAVKAKWLGNLLRGYPQGQKPLSINEVRSLFGFQPIKEEETEEKPEETPETPTEEPEEEEELKEKPEEEIEEESKSKNDLQDTIDELREELEELRDMYEAEKE